MSSLSAFEQVELKEAYAKALKYIEELEYKLRIANEQNVALRKEIRSNNANF